MKKIITIMIVLVMVLVCAGCGTEKTSGENKNNELRDVTVVLDYVPNTNHTGLYVAKKLGYYEELGLNVNIIEPTDGVTATLIAAGKGDFGISYQEDVTYALTAKEPLPIKAIAAIIQHNTSGFASYAPKNIKSPNDFEGKTYTGWGAPSEEAVINAVMNQAGADFDKLKIITSDGSGYNVLKENVDLMWMFWAWDGIAARQQGLELNYIELRSLDKRLDYYTPVIIAANSLLESEPELAKTFLAATTKGYKYAMSNPDKSAGILHEYVNTYDLEMLKESQRYLSGKYSEGSQVWGTMKDSVWDDYTEFMVEYDLIKAGIPAKDCYTNEFLPDNK